jgi:3-dehydroquinate synthase
VEAASGYEDYLHGEAVAIGMAGAAKLGLRAGVTPRDVVERQQALLHRYGLPDNMKGVGKAAALDAMTRDKKRSLGQVNWVLLEAVGRATVNRDVSPEDVSSVLTELGAS